MKQKQPTENEVFSPFAKFFEKALDVIKHPYMKLLVVFIVALLLATFILKEHTSHNVSILIFAVVIIVFAFLAGSLHYLETKIQYSDRTVEVLKKAFREEVMNRLGELKKGKNDKNEGAH